MVPLVTEEQRGSDSAGTPGLSDRFEFRENWASFLAVLDEDRIAIATNSLKEILEIDTLEGKTFLDAGCGSGLFSLAAMRLGATRIHSFDFDPRSVACATELKERYHKSTSSASWTVERGSVLDEAYIQSLGVFSVVYSWGVLHHTGDMKRAMEIITLPVTPARGRLVVAIYNDQGHWSRFWLAVKKTYVRLPRFLRTPYTLLFVPRLEGPSIVRNVIAGKGPFHHRREYKALRGMSVWHDIKDWVGGYPFQVAKPEEVFDFYRSRGFRLDRLVTSGGGSGNNQYVFTRENPADKPSLKMETSETPNTVP
jgi:2-polyprenyl-3-methyl-5-hydroxy-6-metoxy-1,4-benzoquinol methylase